MRFLFVMDPAETMHPAKDTTFAFMRGALARRHETFHCLPRDIANEGRTVTARARAIRVADTAPHLELAAETTLDLATLGAVFIRKDPPFDPPYVHLTHQLDLVKHRVLVLNDPRGLRDANEKLFAFHFAEYMPHSRVTADPREIIAFVETVGGRAVLKPLDGAGGSGVVVLERGDKNLRSLADVWTSEGKKLALVQEYLPAIRTGDKRVLVLDGKPLGAILRVPREDDVRANLHVGGRAESTTLTAKELAAVAAIGPKLVEHGLFFVGLDFIGERLIEVNVTSPTGIQELSHFVGRPVEQDVIAWIEERVQKRLATAPV